MPMIPSWIEQKGRKREGELDEEERREKELTVHVRASFTTILEGVTNVGKWD